MWYICIRTQESLWTVGFFDRYGQWMPESDHGSKEEAAERAYSLNGGMTS